MLHQNSILIVDDHPTNVALLEDIWRDNYALATAMSGEEALAIAPDLQPALVLRFCMTVTDAGPGIAPEVLPPVFEGFVQTAGLQHSEGQGLSRPVRTA